MKLKVKDIAASIVRKLKRMGEETEALGDLVADMNDAQERIATELGVPYKYIKNVDATVPFALPANALETGLLYAEWTKYNVSVPLLTVSQANFHEMSWEENTTEGNSTQYPSRFIIYDPLNITAPVYPVGFESGDLLRLVYRVKPTPLTTIEDDILGGELSEYMPVLVEQYLMFQLLLTSRNPDNRQIGSAFYNDYRKLMDDAFNVTRPQYFLAKERQ